MYLFTGCRLCRRALIEKIDVGGLQNSTLGEGITRFGCLERHRPGFILIFIDFRRSSLISIDFQGFSLIFMDLGGIQSQGLWQPEGAWTPRLDGSPAPIISIARSWRPLKLDKTMIRCIGPGGSDSMHGGPGGIGTESLVGDPMDDDWRVVQHAQPRRSSAD